MTTLMRGHLSGLVLALALLPPTPARAAHATAGGQLADCTFPTLRTALLAGGAWYYAPRQCAAPIVFTGTLTLDRSAVLQARGGDVTLSGDSRVRLFHLRGGTLALAGLTIARGHAPDGAAGHTGSAVAARGADGSGGGAIVVETGATLRIDHCILHDNRAGAGGKGADGGPTLGGKGGDGGAILNAGGSVLLTAVTLRDNSAGAGGRGGQFSDPNGPGDGGDGGNGGAGGAVFNDRGSLQIGRSVLLGNQSGAGGAASAGDLGFNGDGGRGGAGGAVFSTGGSLGLGGSMVRGNRSGDGGDGARRCPR